MNASPRTFGQKFALPRFELLVPLPIKFNSQVDTRVLLFAALLIGLATNKMNGKSACSRNFCEG
jgi:hypothetical protein